MSVVFCGVCPHPPIAMPEVGYRESEEVQDTQNALLNWGRPGKGESGAGTVVIISPMPRSSMVGLALTGKLY